MFVTNGEIDTTVPPIREEVHVDLQVIQVVVFLEDRVTGVGRTLRCRGVVIRLGATWHRKTGNGINRKGGRRALERRALADERIEVTRCDLCIQRGKLSVTAVHADLMEVFIKEARIVAEPANERIVLDVEITI